MSSDSKQIAVAIVEDNDRFLIGLRPKVGFLAGFWEFPGGKVQLGETFEQCALRECYEETGIEVTVVNALPDCVHEYDYGAVHLHFYYCRPMHASTAEPHSPFRWVPRSQLGSFKFPPANADVLRLLGVTAAANPR
jgi:8-oxo-dGTP diphosphatase